MRFLTFTIVFLLCGVFFIISEKGLNVAKTSDLSVLGKEYGNWVISTVQNTMTLAGNAVKGEWIPNLEKETEKINDSNITNKSNSN